MNVCGGNSLSFAEGSKPHCLVFLFVGGRRMGKELDIKLTDYQKEFIRLLQHFDSGRDDRDVFRSFCLITAGALAAPFNDVAVFLGEEYKKYTEAQIRKFQAMLNLLVEGMEKRPCYDFLGVIFESLGMSNTRTGQFFTPENISFMMAKVTFGNIKEYK